MALFFNVEDRKKAFVIHWFFGIRTVADCSASEAVAVLKEGLERTLSQVRQYAGIIEKDEDGGHSIVRRKSDTVRFSVRHFDGPEDNFPSMAEISEAHFGQELLGDHMDLSNELMTFGRKPEAHPDNRPALCSFRANLISGGIILMVQAHHYCNGIAGWSAYVQQIAENCCAVAKGTKFPSFDPRCLDRSLFTSLGYEKPSPSVGGEEDARAEAQPHTSPRTEPPPKRRPQQSLLFHLPQSRATHLKKAASPTDGTWISTYDAVCALMWRVFSRIREPLYEPGPTFKPLFGTGVTIKKESTKPPMPDKMQGSIQFDISSASSPLPQPTLAEVISEVPLANLASYIRQLTQSVTTDMLSETLQKMANVRNKADLSISVDAMPPMALYITDWRPAKIPTFDFGFAEPLAYRHVFGVVVGGQCIVYPPRKGPAGEDEGIELQVTFEEELVPQLVNDPEWSRYFEFRGVDFREEGGKNRRAKL